MLIGELIRKWFNLEREPCRSCETLQMQLSIANDEKRQLLSLIMSSAKSSPPVSPPIEYEKLAPKAMTWNVRRQLLEQEDRAQAKILAEQKAHAASSIANLEKELGLEEEVMK